MDQTQQQTTDQPQVQWGPGQRTGQVLSTHTLEGEEFSVTRSDGWHERTDLPPGHYQRDEVPGKTRPCILTIRSKDLKPAEPAPVKPERAAGLREDLATALASVRAALDGDLPEMARLQLVNAERDLMGALAQVAS